MAKRTVYLHSAEYDTTANSLTLTMAEEGFPAPPPGIRSDLWTEGPHAKVTFSMNVPKPIEVAPTGMETRVLADGTIALYRWTYDAKTLLWGSSVRVNPDGTVYVA